MGLRPLGHQSSRETASEQGDSGLDRFWCAQRLTTRRHRGLTTCAMRFARISFVGVIFSGIVLVGCGADAAPVTIQSVEISPDGRTLGIVVNACPSAQVDVEEFDDRVVLSASAKPNDDDCAAIETVSLGQPVGDRTILDGRTNDTIVRAPAGP